MTPNSPAALLPRDGLSRPLLPRDMAACRPAVDPPLRVPGGIFSFAHCRCNGALPQYRLSAAIINCLRQAAGGIVLHRELVAWIWIDDPSGGPLNANDDIARAVYKLRRKGFPIRLHKGRGYSYGPTEP